MSVRKRTKEKLNKMLSDGDVEGVRNIKKGINNRVKGHTFERKLVKFFKEELGYSYTRTTRNSSKVLDSCGVDLDNIPFLVQCKKGYAKARPKADEMFKEMERLLNENFPKDDKVHTYPKILIHEIDGKHKYHKLVTMSFDDFRSMLLEIKNCNNKDYQK